MKKFYSLCTFHRICLKFTALNKPSRTFRKEMSHSIVMSMFLQHYHTFSIALLWIPNQTCQIVLTSDTGLPWYMIRVTWYIYSGVKLELSGLSRRICSEECQCCKAWLIGSAWRSDRISPGSRWAGQSSDIYPAQKCVAELIRSIFAEQNERAGGETTPGLTPRPRPRACWSAESASSEANLDSHLRASITHSILQISTTTVNRWI